MLNDKANKEYQTPVCPLLSYLSIRQVLREIREHYYGQEPTKMQNMPEAQLRFQGCPALVFRSFQMQDSEVRGGEGSDFGVWQLMYEVYTALLGGGPRNTSVI